MKRFMLIIKRVREPKGTLLLDKRLISFKMTLTELEGERIIEQIL